MRGDGTADGAGAGGGRTRSDRGGDVRATDADGRVLERVRGLLAKAESTTFPAEAEALTAKAQELMSRYAIDHLAVGAGGRRGEQPGRITLVTEAPYASAKAHLLAAVAAANRCQAVWTRRSGEAVVFGFPADLEAAELLYTSLLVQASSAMAAAGQRGAHARSRGFRHAFLLSFAHRIGQRLQRAAHEAAAAADDARDGGLLPVLAARTREVEAAVAEAFPRLGRMRTSASDAGGWVAGRSAADHAALGGEAVTGGSARGALGAAG